MWIHVTRITCFSCFSSCWIKMWITISLPDEDLQEAHSTFWIQMWIYMSPSYLLGSRCGSTWGALSVAGDFPLAGFRCGSHYLFLIPDEESCEAHSPFWILKWIYTTRVIPFGFRMWIHVRCIICCWLIFSSRWIQMWIHVIMSRIISSRIQILVLHGYESRWASKSSLKIKSVALFMCTIL
jgi:hypothetical protein